MKIQDYLPLTEATFFILLSLATEPKHGYAIMKEVKTLSDNRVNLSTGTLYGAIKRLQEQGWITRLDKVSPAEGGRERKAYALTVRGRQILEAEVERLGKLVRLAQMHILRGDA